jgi:hypothetical protein
MTALTGEEGGGQPAAHRVPGVGQAEQGHDRGQKQSDHAVVGEDGEQHAGGQQQESGSH